MRHVPYEQTQQRSRRYAMGYGEPRSAGGVGGESGGPAQRRVAGSYGGEGGVKDWSTDHRNGISDEEALARAEWRVKGAGARGAGSEGVGLGIERVGGRECVLIGGCSFLVFCFFNGLRLRVYWMRVLLPLSLSCTRTHHECVNILSFVRTRKEKGGVQRECARESRTLCPCVCVSMCLCVCVSVAMSVSMSACDVRTITRFRGVRVCERVFACL